MSEFDFVPASNEDPAADFLAREQSALGDLDDDFAFNNNTNANKKADPFDGSSSQSDNKVVNGDFTNGEDKEPSNGNLAEENEDELANGLSEMNIKSEPIQEKPLISQPIIPAEEPESIKKWRDDHRQALQAKDAEEEQKIVELKDQGKKELDEWYARYSEQLQKAKQQNRNAEKEWLAERDSNETPTNGDTSTAAVKQLVWERITRLCDFNPKTSRNTKDVTRMKSILLQLKQKPATTGAQQNSS